METDGGCQMEKCGWKNADEELPMTMRMMKSL